MTSLASNASGEVSPLNVAGRAHAALFARYRAGEIDEAEMLVGTFTAYADLGLVDRFDAWLCGYLSTAHMTRTK